MEGKEVNEKNKETLKSETWQKAKEAMIAKRDIQLFTSGNGVDNAYGAVWGETVNTYLKTGYKDAAGQGEVETSGITYKVLRQDKVTTFYDADGNTLFNIENERLEQEYSELMNAHVEENQDATIKESSTVKYSSGTEKLQDEEKRMLESVKAEHKAVMKAQFDPLFNELIGQTKKNPEFEKKVLLSHKSMERCMKFCSDKAMGLREPSDKEKADARNNNVPIVTPVGGDVLFGWIQEYYDMDDKDEIEKEEKKKDDEKKRKSEVKKKADAQEAAMVKKKKEQEVKKKAETAKKVEASSKNEEIKTTGPKKKEMENQLSLFDMMGV